jgi:polysaccharide pyruvyl transferase WcaK-like protein
MCGEYAAKDMGGVSSYSHRYLRIGLISPYVGTNLGDAAIIESARTHLIRLFPKAEFLLIVLDCEYVSNLHGLEAFPLAAIPLPFYNTVVYVQRAGLSGQTKPRTSGVESLRLHARSELKKIAGRIPLLLSAARRLRDGLVMVSLEIPHLLQARKVVNSLDGLIIAGGGQFDDEYGGPWGHPYSMFKWITLANSAHVPVFFVGVGVDDLHHSLSKWFLRHILARARRVSLRDAGSNGILRRVGIQRELIACPDLAFGMPCMNDAAPLPPVPASSKFTIGLSPISFGLKDRWPTIHSAIFERYWVELKEFAASLLRANHSLKIFVTDGGDEELAKMLYDHLAGAGADGEHVQLFPLLRLQDHITLLRSCDAVVASRLHGVLLSHAGGVPVLAISYRRKVRVHMEDMGQEQFCLDFETFTSSEARDSLFSMLADRSGIVSALLQRCTEKCMAIDQEFSAIGAEMAI